MHSDLVISRHREDARDKLQRGGTASLMSTNSSNDSIAARASRFLAPFRSVMASNFSPSSSSKAKTKPTTRSAGSVFVRRTSGAFSVGTHDLSEVERAASATSNTSHATTTKEQATTLEPERNQKSNRPISHELAFNREISPNEANHSGNIAANGQPKDSAKVGEGLLEVLTGMPRAISVLNGE